MFDFKQFEKFINNQKYDIRVSKNARWIDQKCTPDVVRFIADCIYEINKHKTTFTVRDLWNSDYADYYVKKFFNKPKTSEPYSKNEYDKFFSQPLNLLNYMGILNDVNSTNNRHKYEVKNSDALEFIKLNDQTTAECLVIYITKVISDSGLTPFFEDFFNNQDKTTFQNLKETFVQFHIKNTNIEKEVECRRIFTKVLNPLAWYKSKKGTKRGRLSREEIGFYDLNYNNLNFRDKYANKPKKLSRNEWEKIKPEIESEEKSAHLQSESAKKRLSKYTKEYRHNLSELKDESPKLNMHHIFMASEFPEISMYLENIIAITPNEHATAHLKGTQTVDTNYQKKLLKAKAFRIYENIKNIHVPTLYSWKNFVYILKIGFHLSDESLIKKTDIPDIKDLENNTEYQDEFYKKIKSILEDI